MLTTHSAPDVAVARWTLLAACLAMGAVAMSITASAVALTDLQAALGVGITELQWVQNGFILSFAALLLPAGALADRLGQRPLFLLGGALFLLATALTVLAPAFPILMTGRVLQGVGGALLSASGPPALTVAFTSQIGRERAFGLLGATGGIGLTLGALVAGAVTSWSGWRSAFAIHVPFVIGALIAAVCGFTGGQGRKSGRFDYAGTVCACTFIACSIAFGIVGADQGWIASPSLTLLGIAAFAGVAFVAVEVRAAAPLIPLMALRNARFLLACAMCLLFTTVWVALFIYVPMNVQAAQARTALDAGTTMLALMVPALVMPVIATRAIRRVPVGVVLTGGFLLMAAGLLALHSSWSGDTRHGLELIALLTCGSGAGALYGLLDYLALTALPLHQSSTASAAFNLVRLVGDALGAIIPGAILLHQVRAAFTQAGVDASRELLGEIAAGRFSAADRIHADPQLADSLAQLAATSFGAGIGHAVIALLGIALAGAALAVALRSKPGRADAAARSHPSASSVELSCRGE